MSYRDVHDPRVAGLKQVIATEPQLLAQRARVRHETDALQQHADRLGIEVAETERQVKRNADGGVIAAVSGLLGGSKSPEDLARMRRELDEITAKLAVSEAEEHALQTRLKELAASRQQLSALIAASATALRTGDGPLGDELRTLQAAMHADDETLTALDAAIVARDRAETVITGVLSAKVAASEERGPMGVLVRTTVTAASIAGGETPPKFGVEAARARAQMPEARERIAELVEHLDTLRNDFQLFAEDRSLDLVRSQLASLARASDAGARDAASASACLERLLVALATERRTIALHRDQLAAREREILERSI